MALRKLAKIEFLRFSQVKHLNARIEGGASRLLDEGLVQSALHSPINQAHYGGVTDLVQLTAALSFKLIKNHGFANGNKRTAMLAANLLLYQNGKRPRVGAYDVEDNATITAAYGAVAEGKMGETELAEVYRRRWQDASDTNEQLLAS